MLTPWRYSRVRGGWSGDIPSVRSKMGSKQSIPAVPVSGDWRNTVGFKPVNGLISQSPRLGLVALVKCGALILDEKVFPCAVMTYAIMGK